MKLKELKVTECSKDKLQSEITEMTRLLLIAGALVEESD